MSGGEQVSSAGDSAGRRLVATLALLAAGPLTLALALAFGHDPVAADGARDGIHREDGFAGALSCRACHPDQHATWDATFHATMTQRPEGDAVRGAFDGRTLTYQGRTARVFRDDGAYRMELPASAGEPARVAEVALTVGSRRYQQYFEREGGTYRRLPFLWHIEAERWLHMNTVFLAPDDPDWDQHRTTWNANCIFCHNTGPRPGLAESGDAPGLAAASFDSRTAELGIACESCHGPGEEHAARQRDPLARYSGGDAPHELGEIVNPAKLAQRERIGVCGQCHGQRLPADPSVVRAWLDDGPSFRPGDELLDHVAPVSRDTPSPSNDPHLFRDRFWGDGTPRLTAYELQGVLASRCADGGEMTCGSCHSSHGGDPRGMIEPELRGDGACTSCHADIAADVAAHTGHPLESAGSRCLDCHMPKVVYGVLDVHRSHRIDSPDPRRDFETGRPNACALCHVDRSPLWITEEMSRIWGREFAPPRARPNRAPLDLADGLATLLGGDAVERAVMAAAMGREGVAVEPRRRGFLAVHLALTLGDGYPSVRWLARRSLLALDRELALGLDFLEELDTTDADARAEAIAAVIERVAEVAPERFDARPELLLTPDHRADLSRAGRLLELQDSRVIRIGE